VQRGLLIAGFGVHPTIIVGSPGRARDLHEKVSKYPALGYRVIGLVTLDRRRIEPREGSPPVLGHAADLPRIIRGNGVREVLVALDSHDHERLLEVVGLCSGSPVGLKIVPDLYDIISGMARTNAIYGFPLIEISPQLLKPWEEAAKRGIDIAVSGIVLLAGLPLWLIIALAIKLDTPGPVLYKQERVGRNGEVFNMTKFRSMVRDAEKEGPRWASRRDPRITRVGGVLRRLHLDEVPQLMNVLKGEMSLVGPRPERPVFVEELTQEIPMYPRRLRVRPGLTGWAQIKHKYDESVEDVRRKVQYDLYYIENISLRMDLKILLSTVSHMLMGKGH
jgi:exopolysaccharide biosynthesis polyprenyl glycosylphosphotransferase